MKYMGKKYAEFFRRFGVFALCLLMVAAMAGVPAAALAATTSPKIDDFGTPAYEPELPEDGSTLEKGDKLVIRLKPDEQYRKDGVLFDTDRMYYQLPKSGLTYYLVTPEGGNLTVSIFKASEQQFYELLGKVAVTEADKQVVVTWDKDSEGYPLLAQVTNAEYELAVQATVDGSSDVIVFDDDHKYYVDNTGTAHFTKSIYQDGTAITSLTSEQKKAYTFRATMTCAKTNADGKLVRYEDGHIEYEEVTKDFTLADMTAPSGDEKLWKISFDNIKPGTSVSVVENAHCDFAGYTYNDNNNNTTANTAGIEACTSETCSMVNNYTQDKGELKVTKKFAQDSDLPAFPNNQIKNIKITVTGYANSDPEKKNPLSYTLDFSEAKNNVLTFKDIPAGTYTLTETAGVNGYEWVSGSYVIDKEKSGTFTNPKTSISTKNGEIVINDEREHTVALENKYTRDRGSMNLKKEFAGADLTEDQKKKVTFNVMHGEQYVWLVTVENGYQFAGYSSSAAQMPAGAQTGAFCAFTYADIENAGDGEFNMRDLPTGTYTIVESGADFSGYTRTTTYKLDDQTHDNNNFAVNKDANTQAKVVNTYEENGKLTVTKTHSGRELTDKQKGSIKFKLERKVEDNWVCVGEVSYKDLGSGYTWSGLEYGTYRVTESGADLETGMYTRVTEYVVSQYEDTAFKTGATQIDTTTGEINVSNPYAGSTEAQQEVQPAKVAFTNTYTRITTNLDINKVIGTYPTDERIRTELENALYFTVESGGTPLKWTKDENKKQYIYNENGNVTQIKYTDIKDNYTDIKDNYTITGVPVGVEYTISEYGATLTGYLLSVTATSGGKITPQENQTNTVEFTNTYTPTGELQIVKLFSGDLNDSYCNSAIKPQLIFHVWYEDEEGNPVNVTVDGKQNITYDELANGILVTGDRTYYIREVSNDPNGNLEKYFTITTTNTGAKLSDDGKTGSVQVGPGETKSITFTNRYTQKTNSGIEPGKDFTRVYNHKTWTGLDNGPSDGTEGEEAREKVRFVLERRESEKSDYYVWKEYTWAEFIGANQDKNSVFYLPAGDYRLKETPADMAGYKHSATIYIAGIIDKPAPLGADGVAFTLPEKQTVTISLANVYEPLGDLKITKVIDQTGSLKTLNNEQKKNVQFTVYRRHYQADNAFSDEAVHGPFTLASNEWKDGVYTVTDLPVGTFVEKNNQYTLERYTYVVKETNAIDGYNCETVVKITQSVDKGEAGNSAADSTDVPYGLVTLDKTTDSAMTFTNKYIRQNGALTISKSFGGDLPAQDKLNAVSFELRDAQGGIVTWNDVSGSHVYAADGAKSSFTYADMSGGQYTISGLPTGSYTVVEKNADVDTYVRTTTITVRRGSENGVTTTTMTNGVRPQGVTQDASSSVTLQDKGACTVEISNTYTKIGSLKLTKAFTFVGDSSMSEEKMKAMVFTIKKLNEDNTHGDKVAQINLSQATKNADGTFEYVFNNLPVGKYVIIESNADHTGYTRETTVTVDGVTTTTTASGTTGNDGGTPSAEFEIAYNQQKTVAITNNYEERGKLTITKTYSGLTSVDWDKIYFVVKHNGEILPANDGTYVMDGQNTIGTVKGGFFADGSYTLNNLPAGTYTVEEVVVGESNDIADTDSTYYGYVHKSTTVQVGGGTAATTMHDTTIDSVSGTGSVSAGGVTFAFTNTYESVPRISATKSDDVHPNTTSLNGLPLWRFDITISNISTKNVIDGKFEITDVFDTDYPQWFKVCEADGYAPGISGATLEGVEQSAGKAVFKVGVTNTMPSYVKIHYYLQPVDQRAYQTMLADEGDLKKSSVNGKKKTWHFINTITYHPIPQHEDKEGELTQPTSVSTDYYYMIGPISKSIATATGKTRVTFTLNINPDGLTIGNGDPLVIYDSLSQNLEVDLTSFDVMPASEKANVKPERLANDEKGRKQMKITVPNGKALTISYEATIIGDGLQDVNNNATFLGVTAGVEDKVDIKNSGVGSASLPCINLHKYGHTELIALSGAQFKLYEVIDENGSARYVDTYTTNENGRITVESGLKWETLYYFEESVAPEGYALDSKKIYFRVYDPYDAEHADTMNLPHAYVYGHTLMHNNQPHETTVSFAATKTLAGYALAKDMFTFDLKEGDMLLQAKKNDENGNVTFDPITYSYNDLRKEDGTYAAELVKTYTICEEIPVGDNGFTYDKSVYTATVTIKLNADKTALEANVVYSKDNETLGAQAVPGFANRYESRGSVLPAGKKTLSGASPIRDEFSFVITGAGDAITVATEASDSNTADIPYPKFAYVVDPDAQSEGYAYAEGTVTLTVKDAANFENYDTDTVVPAAGHDYAFSYTIKEEIPADAGCYAYDASEYAYVVSVKTGGALGVTASLRKGGEDAAAADFTNTFYGGLAIKKNVTLGSEATTSAMLDGTYTFNVYTDESCTTQATDRDGNAVSAEITITNGASKTATIDGLLPGDYWVKEDVADDAMALPTQNPVKVTVSGDKNADVVTAQFTNDCGVGSLKLTKAVEGTQDKTKTFTFEITLFGAADKEYAAEHSGDAALTGVTFDNGKATVRLKADEWIQVNGLPHAAEYTIREINLPDGYTAKEAKHTGKIDAAQTDEVTQTNIYAMQGDAKLVARKAVTGNPYTGNEEFTFTLAQAAGEQHPEGAQTLESELSQNVSSGDQACWQIKYTLPGTYRYTITETAGTKQGMTYDTAVHTAEVVVTDAGNGTLEYAVAYDGKTAESGLTITNRYSEISVVPQVKKTLVGENAPTDEEFTFVLKEKKAEGGNTAANAAKEWTAKCKAGATASFDTITYYAPGTYMYEITETPGTTQGMIYSEQKIAYTVVVEQAEDGTLSATTSYIGGGDTGNEITNTYEKPVGSAVLKVKKAVEVAGGDDPFTGGKFTFTLAKEDAAKTDVIAGNLSRTIAAEETASWTIDYDVPGEYKYTITETEGSEPGMTYDTASKTVTVTVAYSDDGKTLEATVHYGDPNAQELTITNAYDKPETETTISVTKAIGGEAYSGDAEFEFTLTQLENNLTSRTNNQLVGDAVQKVTWSAEPDDKKASWTIRYDEPGTYYYTIKETVPAMEDAGRIPGMTYSTQTVICTVTVSRAQDGSLVAAAVYTGGDGAAQDTITNTYAKPTGEATISVTKALTGNTEVYEGSDSFAFQLTVGQNVLTSATNNVTDSTKLLQTIKSTETAEWMVAYDTPGTYTYTIEERLPDRTETGMEYDTVRYKVQVTVSRSEDLMDLDTVVSYIISENQTADDLTVTNKYSKISYQPEVKKIVRGENAPDETFTFQLNEVGEDAESNHTEKLTGKAGETVQFSAFTYYQEGTHTYEITEIAPENRTPGMTYFEDKVVCKVTVTEDEATGMLSVQAEYTGSNGDSTDPKNAIVNTFASPKTTAEFKVTKALTGNAHKDGAGFEFELTPLSEQNNRVIAEPTFPIQTGDTATWKFEYDVPGTYYYMITEKDLEEPGMAYDPEGYLVKVVTAYTPDLMGMTAEVTCGTNPQNQETLANGLTVTNKYSRIGFAPSINKAVKALVEGETVPEGEVFTFKLTDGENYTSTATCKDGKTATFNEIVHHEPGTYVYTITEETPALADRTPGMNYSGQTITYTVVVEKDEETGALTIGSETYSGGDGEMSNTITNTYEKPKGEAEVKVLKAMTGDYDGENAFTFKLTRYAPETAEGDGESGAQTADETGDGTGDESGDGTEGETEKMPEVIVSESEQKIGVDEMASWQIQFSEPGTYLYEISEIDGGEQGVIYDKNTYYAKVVVDYAEDLLSLVATVTYGAEADEEKITEEKLTITNKYIIVKYVPEVRKVLLGENPPDETFCFELTDGEDYTDTASCCAAETAQFGEITFYEAGEYVYTIRELTPEKPVRGMSYSDEEITLTVTVTRDEEDFSLQIEEAHYTLDGVITNTYKDPGPAYDYKFSFTKKWDGPAGTGIEWTMYDGNGNVVAKKFNKRVISDSEWYYEAWFEADAGYFIVENVPEGYTPIYQNVGQYADIKDRLYNGGTLINYALPQTGDESLPLGVLLVTMAASLCGLGLMRKKKRN